MPGQTLTVRYRIAAERGSLDARVEALLLEQTVELPRAALGREVLERGVLPEVLSTRSVDDDLHRVELAVPLATAGPDPAGLLNVLFGNSSLQPDVVLESLELPEGLRGVFPGPRFGIAGIRELVGAPSRAMSCTALKPMGLGPSELAELCETFALAGIDVIKDDHGLGDQRYCRFTERIAACTRSIERAADRTGRRSLYVPNLLGTPSAAREQIEHCRENGIRAIMLTPTLIGLPAFHELVAEARLPVLAHPALAGSLGFEPAALLGTVFRLFGADAVIFPHHGGRFAYSEDACRSLAEALRGEPGWLRPSLPVPAGGMDADRSEELVAFYGRDVLLLIGGSLYLADSALPEASARFARRVGRAEGH